MPRLRQLAALLLCALWLPATLHCDLGAAGLDDFFFCATDHQSADTATDGDACDIVESGWIKRAPSTLTVAAPALSICHLSLLCPPLERAPAAPAQALTDAIVAPPEIARTWQFVARAAPPARAPSLAS